MIFQNNILFDKEDTYSLRGFCILIIVLHHIFQFTSSKYGILYPFPLNLILQDAGYLMTGVFFSLSGYGIFQSLKRNNTISLNYVLSHLWKLLKPFVFIFVIDAIVYSISYSLDTGFFIKNLLTLSLTNSGTLWFMKVIFGVYLCVFIVHAGIKYPNIRFLAVLSLCGLYVILSIYYDLGSQWWNSVLCFPLGYACSLVNISAYYEKLRTSSLFRFLAWGGVIALFIITYVISHISSHLPHVAFIYIASILSSIFFALISVLFVSRINIRNGFNNYMGVNSLCIYLFHLFFLQFYEIENIYVYLLLLACGTVVLLSCYSLLTRLVG